MPNDKRPEYDFPNELELQIVEVEEPHDPLKELMQNYHRLNQELDKTLARIQERKRKKNQA